MKFILILSTLLSLGCAATQWTTEYISDEAETYQANKVLVVGLSEDADLRKSFETQMVTSLEEYGLAAVRSGDFFETNFIDQHQTEADLNAIEGQLLEASFDVILLSKVVGTEEKVNTMDDVREVSAYYDSFSEDYYHSQEEYRYKQEPVVYTEYHVQSSIYCICPDKPRELLWSAISAQVESNNPKQGIKKYTRVLIDRLEELSLLVN